MKNSLIKAIVVSSIVLASGCATVLNDESQNINVLTSNGEKMTGNINGIPFTAPGIVSIKRAQAGAILVSDTEGCTPQTIAASSVDMKFFINIFIPGNLFSSSTDFATEEMWKYENAITIHCK